MDPAEAKRRIRVLRFHGYRCHHRERPGAPICGAAARSVGPAEGDDFIALCGAHTTKGT